VRHPYRAEDLEGKVHSFDTVLTAFDGLVGLAWLDLTEMERAREALTASEARYRILAEHASDVVYQIDADGVICWISPSVQRELGYSPEELLGGTRST